MGIDLGKIMVVPRGTYSETETYERLDLVECEGSNYIAKKTVTGVKPSNDGVYWQLHGSAGKTAYQYAQEGGFDGTEEEYAAEMAKYGLFSSEMLKETGKKYTLLWENPNPNEPYAVKAAAQVELGAETISKYDQFVITYKWKTSNAYDQYYLVLNNRIETDGDFVTGVPGGHVGNIGDYIAAGDTPVPIRRQCMVAMDKSYIHIGKCISVLSTDTNNYGDYLIPGKIYGVKHRVLSADTSAPKIGEVVLAAAAWKGEGYLYSQVVAINGVTENSQVDLTPSVEQLAIFYEKDLSFVTENEDGVVTVYAIGQKPQNDYTIQVTITEVQYG